MFLFEKMRNQEKYSLQEVLYVEKNLLVDTNMISRIKGNGWYNDYIRGKECFYDIDGTILEERIKFVSEFRDLLNRSNIQMVSECRREKKRVISLLQNQLKYLDQRNHYSSSEPENKRLMKQLIFEFKQLDECARQNEYNPADARRLKYFFELTKTISRNSNAKKDFSERYHNNNKNRTDTHADEKMVAVGLYSSIIENKRMGILTRDSDLYRLLISAQLHLMHLGNKPISDGIHRLLINNPVLIYYFPKSNITEGVIRTNEILGNHPKNLQWEFEHKQRDLKKEINTHLENGGIIDALKN